MAITWLRPWRKSKSPKHRQRKLGAVAQTSTSRLRLESLEERIALATWTGFGSDNLWSTDANWVEGQPGSGEALVFPVEAFRRTNSNDLPAGTFFDSITFDGGGYTITGNRVRLDVLGGITSNVGVNVVETDLEITFLSGNLTRIDVAAGATLQIGGVISGTGGIGKVSGGQLILAGANTYQDHSTLAGLVTLLNASGLGAGGSTTNYTDVAGTLEIQGNLTIANEEIQIGENTVLRSVSGTNVWGGEVNCVSGPGLVAVNAGSQLTVTGELHGNGTCTKTGPGRLVLTAINQNSGSIRVDEGTLNIQNGQALGFGGQTIVEAGATLEIQGNITVLSEDLFLNGFGVDGLGALRSIGGNNTLNQFSEVNLASDTRIGVNNGTTLTIEGVISGATGADLTKGSAGTLILTGTNTYPGATFVNNGIVQVRNDFALGATTNGTTVNSGATLQVSSNGVAGEDALALNGAGFNGLGALHNLIGTNDWDGNITLNTSATVRNDALSVFDLDGVIAGANSAQLTKTGAGLVRLRGANTYQGSTNISQGSLQITTATALGAPTNPTLVANGASLMVSGAITVNEPANLLGTGINGTGALLNVADNNTWAGLISPLGTVSSSVAIGVASGQLTSTGGFGSGAFTANLTKVGPGTLVIANSVPFTNTITVNAGTLRANGFQPDTPVVVNSAATLGGDNAMSNVTVNAGGLLSPGSVVTNVGRLVADGNITFAQNSVFNPDLSGLNSGTGFDQLLATGTANHTVTLGGATLLVDCINGFVPPAGSPFTIIDNASNGTTTGSLRVGGQTVAQGGFFAACGLSFQMNYAGGNGNDIVITRNNPTMAPDIKVSPARTHEGGEVNLTGSLVDPNEGDQLTLVVDWGDGSSVEYFDDLGTTPFSIPHTYANDGRFLVNATWFDDHGEGNSKKLPVGVLNVDPTLSNVAVTSPITVGQTATLSADIADPGVLDALSLVVDWGDDTQETISYAPGTSSFEIEHPYAVAGTFTIQMTLFDDAGSTSASLEIVVSSRSAPGGHVVAPATTTIVPESNRQGKESHPSNLISTDKSKPVETDKVHPLLASAKVRNIEAMAGAFDDVFSDDFAL